MYVLKLALRPWRVAPLSQLASSLSVGFLIFAIVLLSWLVSGLGPVISRLKSEQVATAFLVPSATTAQEKEIEDSIRTLVGAAQVRSTNAEKFIADLKVAYPDLAQEVTELTLAHGEGAAADQGIIPRFVTVSGVLRPDQISKLKAVPGVESVETSEGRRQPVADAFGTLRWISRFLAGGMLLALLTGLLHLARVHAQFHGSALSILELWGATPLKARLPSAISGFSIGGVGGLSAAIVWLVSSTILKQGIVALSPALQGLPGMHPVFALLALAIGGGAGLACGMIGAVPSHRTHSRNGG